MKFVREEFPKAQFTRIYCANEDGWDAKDFHGLCDNKGWTINLIQTKEGFIFGGFTTK